MRALAIRVGSSGPEVAVGDGTARLGERARPGGRAEELALLVREAMAEAGWGFADLDVLAVSTGPGSFTAIRAAVAAIRALALATGLPVYASSDLELAAEILGPGPELLVLAPAGRQELVVQRFGVDGCPLEPPRRVDRAAARVEAESAPRLVLVDVEGWDGPTGVRLRPSAGALLAVAAARRARGVAASPGGEVRPLYLRPPDARPEAGRPLVARA